MFCSMSTHVLREERWSGSSSYRTSTVVRGSAQKQVFSGSHTVMYTISARTRDLSLPPVWLQVLLRTLKTPILIVQYTNRSLLTPANRHMSSPPPSPTTATGIIKTLHHISQRILLVGGSSFWFDNESTGSRAALGVASVRTRCFSMMDWTTKCSFLPDSKVIQAR